MTKEKKKFQPLTSKNICEIYNLLHSEGLVSFPLTKDAPHKIDSLVSNINGTNFGVENYDSVHKKVVAYLYFIIKSHPFTDGNKRTGVLCFLVLCRKNNIRQHLKNYNLDNLAVFLEKEKVDHQVLIDVVAESIFNE